MYLSATFVCLALFHCLQSKCYEKCLVFNAQSGIKWLWGTAAIWKWKGVVGQRTHTLLTGYRVRNLQAVPIKLWLAEPVAAFKPENWGYFIPPPYPQELPIISLYFYQQQTSNPQLFLTTFKRWFLKYSQKIMDSQSPWAGNFFAYSLVCGFS